MRTIITIAILIANLTSLFAQDQTASKKYISYALSDSVVQSDLMSFFEKDKLVSFSVKYKEKNFLYSVEKDAIKESSEKPEEALIVKITSIIVKNSKKGENINVEMIVNKTLKIQITIINDNGVPYTRKVKSKTISGKKKMVMVYFSSN